jgi:hypothetical protein
MMFQGKKGKRNLRNFGPLFQGKKGSIILVIFGLLVVIGIVVAVNAKAASYAKSDAILKKNIANDLALMIDTLVGFPGDVLVEYPKDVSKYNFLVSSTKVVVFIEGDTKFLRAERKYTLPDGYDAGGDVEKKEKLCVRKTRKNIFLEECK